MVQLVPLQPEHRRGFIDVFNYYVLNSPAAFPEQPVPDSFFDRFLAIAETHPACVMLDDHQRVVGFALLHAYHWCSAFDRTAEITYFIHPDFTHQGLGKTALDWLLERAQPLGIDRILACISSLNDASLAFHRKFGFVECGRFPQVGQKHGQEFDLVWMMLQLKYKNN